MKKKLMVILCAILLGCGIAYFIFSRKYVEGVSDYVTVKAFQIGVFTNYDNALRVAERNNGIVVNDEEVYRVYVSILSDRKVVDKMKSYYDGIGLDYYLKEIKVSKEFLKSIESEEKLLFDSSSDAYNIINLSVLSKYEEML